MKIFLDTRLTPRVGYIGRDSRYQMWIIVLQCPTFSDEVFTLCLVTETGTDQSCTENLTSTAESSATP
jgi:hypothetical protein